MTSRIYTKTVCAPALDPKGPRTRRPAGTAADRQKMPPRSEWYQEPAKVFDNLYWLGSWGSASRVPGLPGGDSTWAVTTSAGIILIDSGYRLSAPVLITEGLKKVGLDPTQIKYVIISHAHSDRYWGSKYLQDTYQPHLILSEADWNGIEKSPDPDDVKPKKDMVATDGMKLTLGDTTLTIYLTPGHTPGTISTLVPLKDGNQTASWRGMGRHQRHSLGHGVRNGPTGRMSTRCGSHLPRDSWILRTRRGRHVSDNPSVL